MLQARLMSYADAHRYRVGNNYHELPVNKPRCPVHNYQRDGVMSTGQGGSSPNYYPNSHETTPKPNPAYKEPAWHLGDVSVDRYNSREGHDDYTQAGDLDRLFDEGERERLTTAIAGVLGQCRPEVQARQVRHFHAADPDYARRVAEKIGLDLTAALCVTEELTHV
jgi:catalase